jgi:AAA15 family ATPase/GTPase
MDKCHHFKNKMPFFKMMTFIHDIPNSNKQVEFDFPDESDGTIRLLDLIPLLGDVKNNRIVFIDELDRSLHPKLTKHIIETCVSNSEKNESQLIATSHDINLLDPSLLRRDAIWFVRKNQNMGSTLYSLEEFKTRNDKDLRNAYMEGLYGAIPYV